VLRHDSGLGMCILLGLRLNLGLCLVSGVGLERISTSVGARART
jgi:hypothetical protein